MFARSLVLFLIAVAGLQGQTSLGRIRGTVSDSSGGIIPAAEGIAINQGPGLATRTTSNNAGVYAFAALAPGKYRVEASRTGFKRAIRQDIVLETADVLELNLNLQVGELSESISVSAEAALLENTTGTVGQLLDNRL